MLRDESVAETEQCLEPRAMLRDGNDAWSPERCFETRAMPRDRAMRGAESDAWELKAILADESDNWRRERCLRAESDPLQTRAIFEDEIDAERRERCLALEVTLDLKSESCKLEFQLFSNYLVQIVSARVRGVRRRLQMAAMLGDERAMSKERSNGMMWEEILDSSSDARV